jgi:hypothetical protein
MPVNCHKLVDDQISWMDTWRGTAQRMLLVIAAMGARQYLPLIWAS